MISQCTHLRMRNVADKSCRENEKSVETYSRAGQATGDGKIRRMCIAFWIVTLRIMLPALLRQQWLRERV